MEHWHHTAPLPSVPHTLSNLCPPCCVVCTTLGAKQELSTWNFKNKLLVTGTPLQNSMRELWALLNFLEPGRFGAMDEFEAAYKMDGTGVRKEAQVV